MAIRGGDKKGTKKAPKRLEVIEGGAATSKAMRLLSTVQADVASLVKTSTNAFAKVRKIADKAIRRATLAEESADDADRNATLILEIAQEVLSDLASIARPVGSPRDRLIWRASRALRALENGERGQASTCWHSSDRDYDTEHADELTERDESAPPASGEPTAYDVAVPSKALELKVGMRVHPVNGTPAAAWSIVSVGGASGEATLSGPGPCRSVQDVEVADLLDPTKWTILG